MHKQLIELMKEARIEWPAEANYATQDKASNRVYFYVYYPVVYKGAEVWIFCDEIRGWGSIELPKRCHKWSKTIVTKEQYFAED